MFLKKENLKESRKIFNKAVKIGASGKIKNRFIEKDLKLADFNKLMEIPNEGEDLHILLKEFKEEIIPFCSNLGSGKFMGFPDAGNSVAGITGAILSDFLQQNLINKSFCSPIATHMEIAVISWLREILGYKVNKINDIWEVGGIITYGGTGSNCSAMMLAREHHRPNTMKNGVTSPNEYKVIIPKGIGHYSIKSSSMWLGLGDNVIEADTINFKYDLKQLRKIVKANKGEIMAIVIYIGDSRTMTVENIKGVYEIIQEEDPNIWLHADACHGFSLAFSKELRNKIDGIELCDSISTDPHKVLDLPYCLSALLVKDPKSFKLITSSSDLIMNEKFAFGQITPFIGSKSWVSLKLWFVFKNLGIKGIAKMIENRCKMAQSLKDKILKDEDFVLLNDVDINSVVFMWKPAGADLTINRLNDISKKIHSKMLEEGIFHLHQFSIEDNKGKLKKDSILYPLRYMSGNPNITKKNLDDMLSYVKKLGKELINE